MSSIRPASSVLLTRGHGADLEIFLVKRAPELRFMGGFWAFPGGTVMEEDRAPGLPLEITHVRCAMRELFEETGVLPAAIGSGRNAEIQRIRRELLDESTLDSWLGLLDGCTAAGAEFTTVCSLTTPPFAAVRYQTCFLHIDLPEGAAPVIEPGELVDGAFFTPSQAVAAWIQGRINIAPPNLFLLRLMAENDWDVFLDQAAAAAERVHRGALHSIYFNPGIFLAALPTPTLPPASSTNTLIVGTETLYLVEPATPHRDEQERLFARMDELLAAGKRFAGILLTHHHADHVGAVSAASQRYRLPVRAHALTYDRIPSGFLAGDPLSDGARIELGTAPDGSPDWCLRVIHTPGHASDHLCFLESRYHAALVGDMISTLSTIIIDPPDGHMRTYLESLEKLLSFHITTLYPSHGPVHHDGSGLIRRYLRHRREREDRIIAALDTGGEPRTLEELLPMAYGDVDPSSYQAASRSLLAGLIKLEEDGICRPGPGGWHRLS